ncbi:hypothetical protein PR202_gb21333 [Eleusine coracana subsp. coracana]|uniref:GDSL esterase/lipase n=1 Tax=Eleusine coracana subsp. coracana TaxID=191504 RepID=A0AAV5FAW4_ELECO|nr:hypothetical protein PR202_gb21333 [Eleusine coracana subsp. coracana]
MKLHLAICVVLLLTGAAHVESRRRHDDEKEQQYKMFVFGDSFADVGNTPMTDKSPTSRSCKDSGSGRVPSGRTAERRERGVDPFGMNFAVSGAGAYSESKEAPTFSEQISGFERLVRRHIIDRDLNGSVALVAFSGSHDYILSKFDKGYDKAIKMTKDVTAKIAEGVDRLLALGVNKVIVNTLPPLGCRPWFSSFTNYTSCYGPMNTVSLMHNTHLKEKLQSSRSILLLDMETSFSTIITSPSGHVECRRHGDSGGASKTKQYKLFVFGDSFADNGNYPLADLAVDTRAWYYPYGSSDYDHGASASGRFSDGMVQSDFLARILGKDLSPPAERRREQEAVDPFGMNFAVGGAGVVEGMREAPNFGTQVDKFRKLVKHGIINKDLKDSVALIAFSGKRDYARVGSMTNAQIDALAQKVTSEIADGVEQLLELGVTKVLVDALPPLGCTPWLSRPVDYGSCDGNHQATSLHNEHLLDKLLKNEAVFMLDLKTVFTDFAMPDNPDAGLAVQEVPVQAPAVLRERGPGRVLRADGEWQNLSTPSVPSRTSTSIGMT